jgi:hypothetical protein
VKALQIVDRQLREPSPASIRIVRVRVPGVEHALDFRLQRGVWCVAVALQRDQMAALHPIEVGRIEAGVHRRVGEDGPRLVEVLARASRA